MALPLPQPSPPWERLSDEFSGGQLSEACRKAGLPRDGNKEAKAKRLAPVATGYTDVHAEACKYLPEQLNLSTAGTDATLRTRLETAVPDAQMAAAVAAAAAGAVGTDHQDPQRPSYWPQSCSTSSLDVQRQAHA